MGKFEKVLLKVLSGTSDSNINFNDLKHLLLGLNFIERAKGSHAIFYKDGVEEIINIQPIGSKAKAYQAKRVRNLILKYNLGRYGKQV